jgi:hypothetical protein
MKRTSKRQKESDAAFEQYPLMTSDLLPTEFWHARHACKHAVYWSNPLIAAQVILLPCPWCGTFSDKVPSDVMMIRCPLGEGVEVFAFRKMMRHHRVPWPQDMSSPIDGIIHIYHREDRSCCKWDALGRTTKTRSMKYDA